MTATPRPLAGSLTFPGNRPDAVGQILGPSTDGRMWKTTAAAYDLATDRTRVDLAAVVDPATDPDVARFRLELARAADAGRR